MSRYRDAERASTAVILAVILAFWGLLGFIANHFISKLW